MAKTKIVEDDVLKEGDSYAKLEFRIGERGETPVVSTRISMEGNEEDAIELLNSRIRYGMISTFLSMIEECGGTDITIAKIIGHWLSDLKDYVEDMKEEKEEEKKEMTKEELIEKFSKLFDI